MSKDGTSMIALKIEDYMKRRAHRMKQNRKQEEFFANINKNKNVKELTDL